MVLNSLGSVVSKMQDNRENIKKCRTGGNQKQKLNNIVKRERTIKNAEKERKMMK